MIRLVRLCSAVLMSIVSVFPVTSRAVERGLNEIEAEGGKWAQYYESEDLDGLMTLYVDDAVVALHGQPALFGKQAIRDYFAARLGKAESTFELNYEVRETHGNIAYIISQYWLKAIDKKSGEVLLDAGR